MKKMAKFVMVVAAGVFIVGTAWAYRPSGWAYFDWPYVYDWQWQNSWYYLNETDTQWVYDYQGGTWSHLSDSVLTSGWAYVQWPDAYSYTAGKWFYINESDTRWCMRMDSAVWSRFGTQTCETYEQQVLDFKIKYGKSDEWQTWMINNKSRYINVFNAARTMPGVVDVSFMYQNYIRYDPAWYNEQEHMDVFRAMAEGCYHSYWFNVEYYGDPSASYCNVIAGIPSNNSYASGKDVYLYYETIFNHEFGHVMKLMHHYDIIDHSGDGMNMPPGETGGCVMDLSSKLYCSACRTALGIPLDYDDTTQVDTAVTDILNRYPY